MNRKRIAWPMTILGLLLAAAIALPPRSVNRTGAFFPQITQLETPAFSLAVITPHSDTSPSNLNADSHLRTWRPSPVDAYYSSQRAGYAWILRQMGISESDLDRIASGDFAALFKDLIKKADQGDRSAIRSLGWVAQRCSSLRSEDQLNGHQRRQLQEARLLPPADEAWFDSFLNEDIDTDKQRISDCTVINQDHVDALLTGLSQAGDGAATFLLTRANGVRTSSEIDRLEREAALDGFPEAQYELAIHLIYYPESYHPQPGDPSPADLLRSAADTLATARAELAECEYSGCSGETADPQQAVRDARLAAQQGDPAGMLTLASTAPPSLISPVEAKAWALFDVALQQRGCRVSTVNVNWMKSMAAMSAGATSEAQALADENWQLYGASAMQALGC